MKDNDFYAVQQAFIDGDVVRACELFPNVLSTNQQAWCVFAARDSNPEFLKFALQQDIAPSMANGMLLHLYKNSLSKEFMARNTKMILDMFFDQIKQTTFDEILTSIARTNNYAALKVIGEYYAIDKSDAFAATAAEYASLDVLQFIWSSLDRQAKDDCLCKCVGRMSIHQARALKWLAPRTNISYDDYFPLRHCAFNRNEESFNALLPYSDVTAKRSESLALWIDANRIDMVDQLFEHSNGQDVEDRIVHYGTDNDASRYFNILWMAKKERDLMLQSVNMPSKTTQKSKM